MADLRLLRLAAWAVVYAVTDAASLICARLTIPTAARTSTARIGGQPAGVTPPVASAGT